ncbi:hypothetical protein D9M71_342830 [compost metagenome]
MHELVQIAGNEAAGVIRRGYGIEFRCGLDACVKACDLLVGVKPPCTGKYRAYRGDSEALGELF